jgi:uncharacterized protein YdeI (YjbR/CyaY-like superfamily)
MSLPKNLNFKTRTEWRDWLRENHLKMNEAWVIIFKKNSKKIGLRYSEAVEEALCYGWIDSKMNRVDEDTFRQKFSLRRKTSFWSKINKELALKLIAKKKMTKSGYEAIEEGKLSGKWQQAYTSKTTLKIPDDLQKALQASPKAQRNFQAFSNSTKLIYVNWVQSTKKPETRKKRNKQIVEKALKNVKSS